MAESRYEAFISYRHLPLDATAALRIEKALESYQIPRALRKKAGRSRLRKCFRDQDELPLSEDLGESIDSALQNSDWLIVVCSPDLPKSKWCIREINRFIELGRRDRIIPVLIAGEPEESYPKQLRFIERDGKQVEVEPLSADLRTRSTDGQHKKLRVEKLRIIARILGVGFDDLRRRQRERRLKLALATSAAAAVLLSLFLTYAFIQNSRIDEQRILAATNQASLLIEKSLLYTQRDKRTEAKQLAFQAYDVTKTIHNVNAREALDALAAACYAGDFDTAAILQQTGMFMHAQVFSPDDKDIAGITGRTNAACFHTGTGETVWSVNLEEKPLSSLQYSPDGSKLLALSSDTGRIWVLDAASGETLAANEYGGFSDTAFFLEDGNVALTLGKEASVWHLPDGTMATLFDSSTVDWPANLQASAAGAPNLLAWLSRDASGLFVVGDVRAGTLRVYQTGVSHGMTACCFSPGRDSIAINQAGEMSVVDLDTGGVRWAHSVAYDNTSAPYWFENGLILFAGTAYDARTGNERYTLGGGTDDTLAPSGERTGAEDGYYENIVMDAFIDPSGKFIIQKSMYYHADTGEKACALLGGKIVLACSHTGNLLLVGSTGADFTLVHALGMGTQTFEPAYGGNLTQISKWSPLKGSENGPIMLVEDEAYATPNVFLSPRMFISPDGRFAVFANKTDHIMIWDMDQGVEVAHRFYSQSSGTVDAAFSADSRFLALAGYAGIVTIYDLIENRTLQTMSDVFGTQSLQGIKFNAAGDMVMVENHNKTVYWVYSAGNGALLYRMHAVAPVADFGFDSTTGNAVILYQDGAASIGQIFDSEESLLAFAQDEKN